MTTTFTKQPKPVTSYTTTGKPGASTNSEVFYGWMFLFTIPGTSSSVVLSKVAKPATTYSKVAKP